MTYEQVNNAIRSRYQTLVGAPPGGAVVPTEYANKELKQEQRADKLWVRLSVIFGDANQVSFGDVLKQFRGTGIIEFQVFTPTNGGDAASLAMVDSICDAFRGKTVSGGLVFLAPRPGAGRRDQDLWQVNVTCPFRSDHFAS